MGVQVGAERLFPAWEKFVPCLGKNCSLPRALKFDGRLEEFLRTAERISSDGSTKWARKTPLTVMPAGVFILNFEIA